MAARERRSTSYITDGHAEEGEIRSDIRGHIRRKDQIRRRSERDPEVRNIVTVSRAEGQAGLGMAAGRRRARPGSTAPSTGVK